MPPSPRSRNVAREHGTAQESARSQPPIHLSLPFFRMGRSLATETPRKRNPPIFSREHDGYTRGDGWVVVTCNERARDGNVEHACARSWNARCTLARRNRPERLPGRRRRSPLVVGSPPRRLCPTTLSLSIRLESRGKNGWKSCTVYDRPIIGPVPVESVVSDPIYVAWTAGVGFLTIDRGENR